MERVWIVILSLAPLIIYTARKLDYPVFKVRNLKWRRENSVTTAPTKLISHG